MTKREVVRIAVQGGRPPYVPWSFGFTVEAAAKLQRHLGTTDLDIAQRIARAVRHSSGGFRAVKAMGVELKELNVVQVSMNLTDYTQTPIHRVVEAIRSEAARYGVPVVGSELVGLAPLEALDEVVRYYLQLHDFSSAKIIESHLL